MRLLFLLLLSGTMVTAQDNQILTGLTEPCQEELDKYMAPGAILSPKMLNPPKSSYLVRFLPAVGDQAGQSSCTAFSVAAAVTILTNQKEKRVFNDQTVKDFSYWCSPAFIFNIGKAKYPASRSENCLDGISYIDAFSVVKQYGVSLHGLAPYVTSGNSGCQSKNYPTKNAFKDALKRPIATFQRVERDLLQIKSLLADVPGYPVCISVYIDKGYKDASEGKNNFIWAKKSASIPGQVNNRHAMVIVGYADSIRCFKVLDSKGVLKGDKGFLWLSYDLLESNVIYDAYVCSMDDRILREQRNDGELDLDLKVGDTYETWIKENYFRGFNGFRIGVLNIDKSNQRVTYRISNQYTGEILFNEITIVKNHMKLFELRGKTFTIYQKGISHSKGNPLTPASVFEISFKGENVSQQYLSYGVTEENIRKLGEMTFLGSDIVKNPKKYRYVGPVSNLPLGSILSPSGEIVAELSDQVIAANTFQNPTANTSFKSNTQIDLFSFYYFLENIKAKIDEPLRLWLEKHDSVRINNWAFREDVLINAPVIDSNAYEIVDGISALNLEKDPYLKTFFDFRDKKGYSMVTQKVILTNVTGTYPVKDKIDSVLMIRFTKGIHLDCEQDRGYVDIKLNPITNELFFAIMVNFPLFVKVDELRVLSPKRLNRKQRQISKSR